ncbi:MAG: MerR family transcriptional regulator [candidate division Zixibacteria bacterium]|nr:MerR family transcriptional regulator [candidate division Zixibacteria bacterium]
MTGKLYYSISEVSAMTELEASVLRFWESEFGQLRPKKNRAGIRMYREKDIRLIQEIKRLTREEGYTIAGARKRILEGVGKGNENAPAAQPEPQPSPNDTDLLQWLRAELLGIRSLLNS